jgi:uncharacterized protein
MTEAGSFRVRPRVWIGFAIWVAYALLVFVIQQLSGVSYDHFGDNGGTLFRGAGISLIVATVLLAVTTTLLGWWRPALFDRQHARRWPIIAPALMAIAMILNLTATDWSSFDGAFFAASVVLILVGFTEELTTRGLLLVALRSRLGEGWVWFITSAAFALMHLINALSGQAIAPTLQQVGSAFLGGTIFYVLRRTTGTLIWAMVLHGLWDFSTFAVTHGTPAATAAVGGIVELIAGVLAVIFVAFVIRGSNERLDGAETVPQGA